MKKGATRLNKILGGLLFVLVAFLLIFLYVSNSAQQVKGLVDEKKTYSALVVPNDPFYVNQWNFKKISAETAWDITTGSQNIVIAVLDTGVLTTHEDLVGRTVAGYDFVDNDSDPTPVPGGGAAAYHGTVVSGAVVASGGNAKGIAGSCWDCKVMPLRVLDNDGNGTSDNIAEAITYATDNGAKIINMSFGYEHELGPDSYLTTAIDYAYSRGVIMIAAAGNDGLEINYPAAYEKVIAVGATDGSDSRASWSSAGPELDVTAPGVSVPSTYTYWTGSAYTTNNYANVSGTSIASPQVAGLAGLLVSRYPALNINQVYSRLKAWADKVSGMEGHPFTNGYGLGRSNFYSSLAKQIYFAYPVSGLTLSATSITASGFTDISNEVHIYLDSTLKATLTSDSLGSWSTTVSDIPFGVHTIEARATELGGEKTVFVGFNVDNRTPIYRFWNTNGTHFYTASETEKNSIIVRWPNIFKLEGVAYSLSVGNSIPLYRFYNLQNNTHFYTASEAEKNNIIARWPNIYRLDGVAYNVSASGTPVYRFWNTNGTHFYTASDAEKNNIIARWPNVFKFEGVGYYIVN